MERKLNTVKELEFSLLFTPPSAWTLWFSVPLFFNPCFLLQVPQLNINLRSWKEGSGEEEEETLSSVHNESLFHCCWILFSLQQWLGSCLDCAAEWNRHFSDEYLKSISYDQSRQVGLMRFNVKKISTCSQCITEIINNRSSWPINISSLMLQNRNCRKLLFLKVKWNKCVFMQR